MTLDSLAAGDEEALLRLRYYFVIIELTETTMYFSGATSRVRHPAAGEELKNKSLWEHCRRLFPSVPRAVYLTAS